MTKITAVARALRRSLPFGGEDHPERDADLPEPTPSRPGAPSNVLAEWGLQPEDYLIELCRSHGGRMKQQTVVKQTGWSEPSVSRLLSDMEADGRIVRLSLGREKAMVLPDMLPELSADHSIHA